MFLAELSPDIPIAADLKVFVLIIPVLAQVLKQVPYIKAHADWLMPIVVVAMGIGFAVASGASVLDGIYLGVACLGAFSVVQIPGKVRNGNAG